MLEIDDELRERIREAALERIKVSRAAGVDEEVIRQSEYHVVSQTLGDGELDPDTQETMLQAIQDAVEAAIEATREPGPN